MSAAGAGTGRGRLGLRAVAGISILAVPPLVLSRRQNMPADTMRATEAEQEPQVPDPTRPARPVTDS